MAEKLEAVESLNATTFRPIPGGGKKLTPSLSHKAHCAESSPETHDFGHISAVSHNFPSIMGRQEWEDSLKVHRSNIDAARMGDNDSLRWNEQVDKALSLSVLQAGNDSHLDFLNGEQWNEEPHCRRFYYRTKWNHALVHAHKDTDRGQRSGVMFFFTPPEGSPPATALALLLSHCNKNHRHKLNNGLYRSVQNQKSGNCEKQEDEYAQRVRIRRDEKRCVCSVLSCYLDKDWDRERPLRLWPYPYFKRPEFFKHREAITIQFVFRYAVLSKSNNGINLFWPQTLRGIPSFRRDKGNTNTRATSIVEQRHLLFMKYFPRDTKANNNAEPPYNFTMVSLGPLRHNELHEVILDVQEDEAKRTGDLVPIILFIRYLRRIFLLYAEEWEDVIARIDQEISFKLSDVEDYSKGSQNEAMMHDDASQKTSTAYFKLFQVLRTLDGMVKETLADFRSWHSKVVSTMEGPSHTFENKHLEGAVKEWESWGERLEERLGGIRQRIADKRADVQSLSDNMFNATSIKEARESRVLSQRVMVFTVVTVIYTPLGFVSALFGMNNIQAGSPLASSLVPFGYTLTIVCLTTYLVTFVSVWWFGWIKIGGKGLGDFYKGLTCKKRPGNGSERDEKNVANTGNGDEAAEVGESRPAYGSLRPAAPGNLQSCEGKHFSASFDDHVP